MTTSMLATEIKLRVHGAKRATVAKKIETENKPVAQIANLALVLPKIISDYKKNTHLESRFNTNLFNVLFKKAEKAGLDLLPDDKRWLRTLGYSYVGRVVNQYIQCWLNAMQGEPINFKKQNVGRFKANTFIRTGVL